MERLRITEAWLAELLPEGWPLRTSTLITGPGGSGKPLVGVVVAGDWLRQGGGVVFMSLQYPEPEFIDAGLREMTGVDVADHAGRVAHVVLDTALDGVGEVAENHVRANLVKPDVWDAAIDRACALVADVGPGILVQGSALNLLLFSPTYGPAILDRMLRTIRDDKRRTYVFSVSTSAKPDMIGRLEAAADNLLVSRSTDHPFQLHVRVERMRGVKHSRREATLPIATGILDEMRSVAEHSRRRIVPEISRI